MARSTTNGSTDYLDLSGASSSILAPAGAWSISCWYINGATQEYKTIIAARTGSTAIYQFGPRSTGQLHYYFTSFVNDPGINTLVAGWNHIGVIFTPGSPGSVTTYLNSVADGTSSASASTLGTATSLRFLSDNYGPASNINGTLAEVAFWDASLTAAEVEVLAKGYSPPFIRSASLAGYWPLIGRTSPEIDLVAGNGAVVTGSPTAADHPRIIMQRGKRHRSAVSTIVYVYARPDADSIDGSWTNELNTQVNLFASIDETAADDADYIISSSNPSSDIVKISLSDPGPVAEPATVSYRYCKRGEVSVAVNLTVDLLQGVTSIASWAHTDIGTTFTTVNQTLTAPQFAAISDFNDLYLQFNAST